jgi:predicted 2-oxoglutarate/Fe(II)-dependent dioxygenase YbiX
MIRDDWKRSMLFELDRNIYSLRRSWEIARKWSA